MGNFFSASMEANMKKNQEMMQKQNRIKMEQKLQMQLRQVAMQKARSRDIFHWIGAFYLTAAVGLIAGFRKTKKPFVLSPLMPLTFATLYNWDLAYGNKIERIRKEAEYILTHEPDSLGLPRTLPAPPSADDSKHDAEEKPKN